MTTNVVSIDSRVANSSGLYRSLVVIDPGVEDWQTLVADLPADVALVMLDGGGDGVRAIARAAAGMSGLGAIHVISHGNEAQLLLGSARLSASNLDRYAGALRDIGRALEPHGELLLYGCEVGRGAAGRAFVTALSDSIGVNVAAASHPVGGAALGGSWALDVATGSMRSEGVLTARAVAAFGGLLPGGSTLGGPGGADGDTTPGSDGGTGGGGGAGTVGGNGGTGGIGAVGGRGGLKDGNPSGNGENGTVTLVPTGAAAGGGGGGGAHGYVGVPLPGSVQTGGNGGAGAAGDLSLGGAGGGAGGYGAVVTGTGGLGALATTSTGGAGGSGGSSAPFGGGGGSGGHGLVIFSAGAGLTVGAAVTGGAGGAGGAGFSVGGPGGAGGTGLRMSDGGTVTVDAAMAGGAGGAGGAGPIPGANGSGGAGIVGQNMIVTLGAGGSVAGGGSANAITFTGGTNALTFGGATPSLTGNLAVEGSLEFAQSGVNVTLANAITGGGAVSKTGSATLTLTGTNSYTGATAISGGTLIVDGSIASSSLVTVSAGGVLGGSGTTGAVNVTAGGAVAPGSSPGILSTGNFNLAAGSTLQIEIAGTTAGTGYDQVAVTGSVTLAGALTTSLLSGFDPATGTTFTIIDNDGTVDGVTGTFAGLPEGAVFTQSGSTYSVSYVGGDGNDVVLTASNNDAPLVDLNGAAGGTSATLDYTENAAAAAIAPAATVDDADSADFDGGTLTVAFTASGTADDELTIEDQGTGGGEIGVSGSDVQFGGVTIGTFTGGGGGTNLVVTFNSSAATPEAAEALIRHILYSNTSDLPSTAARTVTYTLVDGDGGASVTTATVNVTAVNDAPSGTDNAIFVSEDVPYALTAADFGFSDTVDGHAFHSVKIASLATDGELRFNGTAITAPEIAAGYFVSKADIDAGKLTFVSSQDENGFPYATFDFQVKDTGGIDNGGVDLDPSANTITFNVSAVNDPPVMDGVTDAAYTENAAPTPLAPALVLVDVDTTTLSHAIVRIADGRFAGSGDVLDADVTGTSINKSYSAANGTLLLSGADTPANYELVLQSVTYSSTSENPTNRGGNATRTIEWQASDGTPTDGPAYTGSVNYPTGDSTLGSVLGDFDGDGDLDLAAVNQSNDKVLVLLGDGAGAFAAPVEYAGGGFMQTVVTGDLDGDNDLDLVTANAAVAGASVLLGNGDGTFAAQTLFGAGGETADVALADFNGDGRLDIAVSNYALDQVSMLPGNGSGGFGPAVSFGAGDNAGALAVVDFDGDGNADLVVGNYPTDEVSLLFGNGDGTFDPAIAFAVPDPVAIAVGDVNGDGKADLAVANDDGTGVAGFVSLLLGDGGGGFSHGGSLAAGTHPTDVVLVDADADGDLDIVATDQLASALLLLRGNGAGVFAGAESLPVDVLPRSVVVGDLNGSGGADLVGVGQGAAVMLNRSPALGTVVQSTVTITAVNDAPAGGDHNIQLSEDFPYTFLAGDFPFSDPLDGGAHTLSAVKISTLATNGLLKFNGTAITQEQVDAGYFVTKADIDAGKLTFAPSPDASGSPYATFTFQVKDSGGTDNGGVDLDASANTITFNVVAMDDAPVLGDVAASASYDENATAITLDSDVTVGDVDTANLTSATVTISNGFAGDELGVTVGGSGLSASWDGTTYVLTLSGEASLATYEAVLETVTYVSTSDNPTNSGAAGTRNIAWQVNNALASNTPATTLTINAADDPAVAKNDDVSTPEDTALTTKNVFDDNNHGVDSDPDTALAVTAVNGNAADVGTQITLTPSGALLKLNADGTFTYNPNGQFNDLPDATTSGASNTTATDTFQYTLNGASTATVTVTITGVDSDDTLLGTTGDDSLTPGIGTDSVTALAGNDNINYTIGDGLDTLIDGGDDTDTLTIFDPFGDHTIQIVTDGTKIVGLGGGTSNVSNVEQAALITGFGGEGIDTLDYTGTTVGVTVDLSAAQATGLTSILGLMENVTGGAGADSLTGDDGANALKGAGGNDALFGGEGDDTFTYGIGDGQDTVEGGEGSENFGDRQIVGGTSEAHFYNVNPVAGTQQLGINIETGAGAAADSNSEVLTKDVEEIEINTGDGGDTVVLSGDLDDVGVAASTVTVTGGSGNDNFNASALTDDDGVGPVDVVLDTLGGNDTLRGGGGDDELYGGDGDDTLYSSTGVIFGDILDGEDDDDTINYTAGHGAYLFDGGDGTDALSITGTAGDDTLAVLAHVTPLVIGIDGGGVLDIESITLALNEGGSDWLDYVFTSVDVTVDLAAGTATGFSSIDGVENVFGGLGNDLLQGDGNANYFDGNGGADTIHGRGGIDTIVGCAGNDELFGDGGDDAFVYVAGADGVDAVDGGEADEIDGDTQSVLGSAESQTFYINPVDSMLGFNLSGEIGPATSGNAEILAQNVEHVHIHTADFDILTPDGGDSVFIAGDLGDVGVAAATVTVEGGGGNDFFDASGVIDDDGGTPVGVVLKGLGGDDSLTGGAGLDSLQGGTGNDDLYVSAGDVVAGETYDGGTGTDDLDVTGSVNFTGTSLVSLERLVFGVGGTTFAALAAVFPPSSATFTSSQLGSGGMSSTLAVQSDAGANAIVVDMVSPFTLNISGWTFAEWSSEDTITINGSASGDFIVGSTQKDTIHGNGGADHLFGGLGADAVHGGAGLDYARYDTAGAAVTVDLAGIETQTGEAAGDTFTLIEGVIGSAFDDDIYGDGDANELQGRNGGDSIFGRAGNDTLQGGDGGDTLDGGDGRDYLFGQGGDDTLDGGTGNDYLYGGLGGDELTGGAGFDYARYDTAAAAVTVDLAGIETQTGEAADDTFSLIEGVIGSAHDDDIYGDGDANELQGRNGGDSIFGRAGNDTLQGGDGDDTLDGGDDNDYLYGGIGGDTLNGAAGFDYARYDTAAAAVTADLAGSVTQTGEAANDTFSLIEGVIGSAGGDALYGDAFANNLQGRGGADMLFGREGTDTLLGGEGDDTLDGGIDGDSLFGEAGADTLLGGEGNDYLTGGIGGDTLNGGDGTDYARYDTAAAAVKVDLAGGAIQTGEAADDTFSLIEGVIGSALGDEIYGDGGANDLQGRNSADSIFGRAGNDTLQGGDGDDTLDGGDNTDYLYGGLGGDALTGGAGFDYARYDTAAAAVTVDLAGSVTQTGEAANDTFSLIEGVIGSALGDEIYGDGGANDLQGRNGADSIFGRAGNDTLQGGDGDDTLDGGDDNDRLVYTAGLDVLNGGANVDTADFSPFVSAVWVKLTHSGPEAWTTDHPTLSAGAWRIIADLAAIENIVGTSGDDYLAGDSVGNRLTGGDGNDDVHGDAGNDTLRYTAGFDVLDGGTDVDTADFSPFVSAVWVDLTNTGGEAWTTDHSTLSVGSWRFIADFTDIENVVGTSGADHLVGDTGANSLTGGAGNDDVHGGAGDDTLRYTAGFDVLDGGTDVDVADFSDFGSAVWVDLTNTGGEAWTTDHPTLSLGSWRFIADFTDIENVVGTSGDDYLAGDFMANRLIGGDGSDTLAGRAGADVFVYASAGDGADTIVDFQDGAGNDVLDIRTVLVGYNPGSSNPESFVSLTESGSDTMLAVNTDGAGADFVDLALLQNNTGLVLNDLIANGNLLLA